MPDSLSPAVNLYRVAKDYVLAQGFAWELTWQASLDAEAFTESDLLRQTAWVILCSGFREAVIRRVFGYISLCFCDWESARTICQYRLHCRTLALARFGSPRKIDAIIAAAELVDGMGFEAFKGRVLSQPIESLRMLPFIGPATAHHLAKNLGIATAKPDRHLQRFACAMGYKDTHHLCRELADATGDAIQVVDLVLWRFAERMTATRRTQHHQADCRPAAWPGP